MPGCWVLCHAVAYLTNGLATELGVRAAAITTELTGRVAADASIIANQVLESSRLDAADTANFNCFSTLVSNEGGVPLCQAVGLTPRSPCRYPRR